MDKSIAVYKSNYLFMVGHAIVVIETVEKTPGWYDVHTSILIVSADPEWRDYRRTFDLRGIGDEVRAFAKVFAMEEATLRIQTEFADPVQQKLQGAGYLSVVELKESDHKAFFGVPHFAKCRPLLEKLGTELVDLKLKAWINMLNSIQVVIVP